GIPNIQSATSSGVSLTAGSAALPRSRRRTGPASRWGRSLDAEAVDLLGMEADEGVAEPRAEVRTAGRDRFGASADLEHARRPGVGRPEIVDDDRRPGVGLDISVLLRRRDVMPADVA